MLAVGPPNPPNPPDGDQWSFEVKWDGVRGLAMVLPLGSVALRSRNGHDLARRYPGIVDLGATAVPSAVGPAIMDGECVAWGPDGQHSFDGARRGGAGARFMVFDVLAWQGRDVRAAPLDERRALLGQVDWSEASAGAWQPSPVFADGPALLEATGEQGLEGVVAKRRDSAYRCGVRSPDWVKLPHRTDTELVVVGWVRAQRSESVASLAVADPAGHLLGTVGSGIGDRLAEVLSQVLRPVSRPTPHPAVLPGDVAEALRRRVGNRLVWVEPVLVAQVRHLGRTGGGSLRQPALVRVCPDRSPHDLGGVW